MDVVQGVESSGESGDHRALEAVEVLKHDVEFFAGLVVPGAEGVAGGDDAVAHLLGALLHGGLAGGEVLGAGVEVLDERFERLVTGVQRGVAGVEIVVLGLAENVVVLEGGFERVLLSVKIDQDRFRLVLASL